MTVLLANMYRICPPSSQIGVPRARCLHLYTYIRTYMLVCLSALNVSWTHAGQAHSPGQPVPSATPGRPYQLLQRHVEVAGLAELHSTAWQPGWWEGLGKHALHARSVWHTCRAALYVHVWVPCGDNTIQMEAVTSQDQAKLSNSHMHRHMCKHTHTCTHTHIHTSSS